MNGVHVVHVCVSMYISMYIVIAVLHGHCNYYVGSIVISVLYECM